MDTFVLKQPKGGEEQPIPGIEFDAQGNPIDCCTVEELFDELDRELIDHYGEYGRKLVNDERAEWNARYPDWHFDRL